MVTVSVEKLVDSPLNFFQPLPEEQVRELAASIRRLGVLHPLVVRPLPDGFYEVLSGHERKRAAELLGLEEVPVTVVEADDATAEMILIDANVTGRALSPMEIARAIRRKKALLKNRRAIRTIRQNVRPVSGGDAEVVAADLKMSARQVQRYESLNRLIPELQLLVGSGGLGASAAAVLAQLPPAAQRELYEYLGDSLARLTVAETRRLKEECSRGYLVLEHLQGRLREAEARLAAYAAQDAEAARLRAEIERLREKKRSLEYDLIDRRAALREMDKRCGQQGAALLQLLSSVLGPVLAARPEIEALVRGASRFSDAAGVYLVKWRDELRRLAELLDAAVPASLKVGGAAPPAKETEEREVGKHAET